jgi:spermidine/putrescine transport system substrate-binding protein
MVLLGMGADPKTASVDELMKAIDKVEEASRSGQIRRFTGNEYTRDLGKGDSWLVLGWSGDAIQLQADNTDIAFVRPEEGFLLWSDNMQIPIGAPHAYTAEKFMDFVYRPEIQKPITEWVNYVCPVKGVRELVERDDPELASDPLIFPTEETLVGATDLRPLEREEERDVESAYQQAIGA